MLNTPLHPMIVHFPIVFAILLPLVATAALFMIVRKSARPWFAWSMPLLLSVVLAGSAFLAVRTGEGDEDRVERVVPEGAIHQHEEAAERFLALAMIVAVLALGGMMRGSVGSAARVVATAGSLVLVLAGYQVGKAGGALVYEHNAGAAFGSGGQVAAEGGASDVDSDGAD